MFRGCFKLEKCDLSNLSTSNVTNMSNMFCDCLGIKDLILSNF